MDFPGFWDRPRNFYSQKLKIYPFILFKIVSNNNRKNLKVYQTCCVKEINGTEQFNKNNHVPQN
jgi:hypothetical protein